MKNLYPAAECLCPSEETGDKYFDLKGLSAYSALGVGTLRDHIRSGNLPCFKVKGKILVKRSEFDQWIENYRLNMKWYSKSGHSEKHEPKQPTLLTI